MSHEHQHDDAPPPDPVDAAETARMKAEAEAEGPTPVGYFLGQAANAGTQRERDYWLARVDGARYMADRQAARDDLAEKARESMEARARLIGTEASLELVRTVGNAVVLRLLPGERAPAGFSLVRRLAGETGTEGYGAPRGDQWVVQGLRQDAVHEFAVVSEDRGGHAEVRGPWLAVPIGDTSTAEIQDRQRAEADQQAREQRERQEQAAREHSERVARERAERRERDRQAAEQARLEREQMERDRIRREEEHARAVEELPLMAPRNLTWELRDQGLPTMTLDVSWQRGERMPKLFQFKLNGSVLGYSGEYDGVKPADHIYRRTVQVPRGQVSRLEVYAVTPHGDGSSGERTIEVPQSLPRERSPEPPAPAEAPEVPASSSMLFRSGQVGGGPRGRYGYASRQWPGYGLTEVAGELTGAAERGILALYEATPGDGNGAMWVITDGRAVSSVTIGGQRVPVQRLNHELFKADAAPWPSREERARGIRIEIETAEAGT